MILNKLLHALKKQTTKKRVLIIFALLLVFYVLTRGAADTSQIQTQSAKRGEITEEVFASGAIQAKDQTILHFPVSGKITWVSVKEGDTVKKGQAIATLDKEKYEIALRQAQQDVVAADAELIKMYDDQKDKSNIESFDEKITRTAIEAKKNKAFDAQKAAERNLKDTILTSPIAGKVLSFNIVPGQEILLTTDIATVGTTTQLEFVGEIDETDVIKIQTGYSSEISLDAYDEESIPASVEQISDIPVTTSTGSTAYEVRMPIPGDLNIRVGMNGEAQIEVSKSQNALFVPIEAIVDDKYVYVKDNGTYVKKEVETGIFSETDIEVTKGLDENQEVLTAGFDQIDKKSNLQKLIELVS